VITLSEKEGKTLAVEALLPQLYQVIGVQGGFEKKRVTNAVLQMGPAHIRKLRRIPFATYVNGLAADHPIKAAYERGDLTIVVADAVVDRIKLDVSLDATASSALDAKFDPTGGRIKQLGGAKLGVKLSSSRTGSYTFEVERPVIIRRLGKRQSAGGELAAGGDDWNDWAPVALPIEPPNKVQP
jgi:hypothetical protein